MNELELLREKNKVLVKRVVELEEIINNLVRTRTEIIEYSEGAAKALKASELLIQQQREMINTLENQLELVRKGVGR